MTSKTRGASRFRIVSKKESASAMAKRRPDLHQASKQPSAKYFLAVNVHRLRRDKGMTQVALARKAKLSLRTIAYLESADPRYNPGLDTVDALAWALGEPVLKLLEQRRDDVIEI